METKLFVHVFDGSLIDEVKELYGKVKPGFPSFRKTWLQVIKAHNLKIETEFIHDGNDVIEHWHVKKPF